MPVESADIVALLIENRQEAHYDLDARITHEEAAILIKKANEILQMTNKYFDQFKNA